MTTFNVLLYSALIICSAGVVYRIGNWFYRKVGIYGRNVSRIHRFGGALKGIIRTLFSFKILKFIQAVILDVILQKRILLKAGFLRWLAHMLIFVGFIYLLLIHALDDILTEDLFPDYYSTLNPYLFLRSLLGVMVLAGVALAIVRRFVQKKQRVKTTLMDKYAIFIVAFIILSGIFLEGLTMTSHSEFERMIYDYAGLDDEEEIRVLESYWVEHYALVSPTIKGLINEEDLALGEELNDTYCTDCHVSNKWGFSGYAAAIAIKPVASWLDQGGGVTVFWYIHIVSCFLGLAILPFTKMFHIISVPVSIIVNAVRDNESTESVNNVTIQSMELDACTHCGVCSQNCSAAMMYEVIGNKYILPSEKMQILKRFTSKKKLNNKELKAIQQGVYLCTSCERCTVQCPSGIRLKDLWVNVREDLVQFYAQESNILSPFSFVRGLQQRQIPGAYVEPIEKSLRAVCGNGQRMMQDDSPLLLTTGDQIDRTRKLIGASDYSYCFDCRNCTTICPVVGSYERPEEELGMLPHQIMCSLGLNLVDLASESPMIWYCLTCYQCQEHCPQKVTVCDHLYSLKNLTAKRVEEDQLR